MERQFILSSVILLSMASTLSFAEVPHTFSTGEPAVATEMNENFQSVTDAVDETAENVTELDQRITSVESQVGPVSYFSGLSMPFL